MEQEVNVKLKIITDGKYCGIDYETGHCDFFPPGEVGLTSCILFRWQPLERCLGGGPLRCAECVAATNGIQEEPK